MKNFENLGKRLNKHEQKQILGGVEDPGGSGGSCCMAAADCPDKEGKSKTCSTYYCCDSDITKYKCFYTTVS